MKKLIVFFFLLFAILQTNCANDNTSGKVVFYREYNFLGSSISYKVYVDGAVVGKLKNNSYFEYTCLPGEHSIQVGSFQQTFLRLKVDSGKTYYLRFGFRPDVWTAVPELLLVDSISAYPTIYQGKMRNLNSNMPFVRPKNRIGFNLALGGGFSKIPMVTTTDGKESSISFGGGVGFAFSYGYELNKFFDLAFDVIHQFNELSPPINNGSVTFSRWILSLNPSYIVSIGDGETMRLKLGAGIDSYLGNKLNIDLSKIPGGISDEWAYQNSIGLHLSAIFELNFSEKWSAHYGLKWYNVSYSFNEGSRTSPTTEALKKPNGSGLDFILGLYYHF